jgi:hypothetical protein
MTEQEPKTRRGFSLNPIPEEARAHARAARAEMRLMVETIVPKPVLERERAARRKALVALRDMLDRAIERLGE